MSKKSKDSRDTETKKDSHVDFPKVVFIPLDKIKPNDYNPNVFDKSLFNEFVEDFKKFGFVYPIIVAPCDDEEHPFRIIDGEHRFDGLSILGVPEAPCIIKDDLDEDQQKMRTVKINRFRGKMDKEKFSKLMEDLLERHSLEELAENMAFTDPSELESMIQGARESLSPEMKREFDKVKDEIKTVDELSLVLNKLFTRFGDTLPANFMVLDFGGKEHLWVRMSSRKDFALVKDKAKEVLSEGYTFDSVLSLVVSSIKVDKLIEKFSSKLVKVKEGEDESAMTGFFGDEDNAN